MEYLLDCLEQKKLKVYITKDQVYMEFITYYGTFSFHPRACQKLMTLKDILIEKLNKIKHDYNIYFVEHLRNNLYVVIESPFTCVQLRYFKGDCGIYKPTVEGISLKEEQFYLLLEVLEGLYEEHGLFQMMNMCAILHQNQEDCENCYNCQEDNNDNDYNNSTSEEEEEKEDEEE